jgi:hypothetical protein
MLRRLRTALSLLLLALPTPAHGAENPSLTLDGRQFPGAPAVVTSMTSYQASGGGSRPHRVLCISFRAHGTQALTAVKFAVTSLDEQGKEYQRMTVTREGRFEPSVISVGDPTTERRNCVDMNVMRSDAPIVAVRLVEATYADGTTWAAPAGDLPPLLARGAPPTPSPLTGTAPGWSVAAHAHYLAVGYGRDRARVALFAPGSTVPSATLEVGSCCVAGLAFDAAGNLFVATTHDGVAVIAPGATAPARKLGTSGTALALDAASDVAVGGEGGVYVYPHGAEAGRYALGVRAQPGGIAFAPNGELAVADIDAPKISVFAPGSTTPSRTVDVAAGTGLIAYDPGSHLAVGNVGTRTITRFEPREGVKTTEIRGPRVRSFAFDRTGRMLIGTLEGVQPWAAEGGPERLLKGPAADVVAVRSDGPVAAGDAVNGVVVLYDGETRTVIGGLDGLRALAFAP